MKKKGKIYWVNIEESGMKQLPTGKIYYAMTNLPGKPSFWWSIVIFLSEPVKYVGDCEVCFLVDWAPHHILNTLDHLDVYRWSKKVATIHFSNLKFREATLDDIPELKEMFQATLRAINKADYTPEEIEDWASCADNTEHWTDLITNLYFVVALNETNQIIGFTSIREDGYLHSMFIHKDYQRQGVASSLLSKAEEFAKAHQIQTITSDVSITAKPFFEKKDYKAVCKQKQKANKLCLTNYRMEKVLK